jgi:minor extracellular serine protease Vpr
VVPPSVIIGGVPATVTFAGLASGFVGLYQVNVQVPSATAPGNAVTLAVSQNGLMSNTVTLAVE